MLMINSNEDIAWWFERLPPNEDFNISNSENHGGLHGDRSSKMAMENPPSSMMSPWKSRFSSMVFPGTSPYLVGGLEHFLFSHILGTITPTDFHIFQRVETTSQHIGDVPLPCWIPNVAGLGKSETVKDLSLEAGVCLGGWPWFKWGNFLGETEKVTAPILYISYWWLDMVYLCIYNIYCIYIYIMCFNCIYIFINRYTHSYWWWLVRGTTPPLGLFQGSCFLSCLDQAWLSVLTIFQIGFPF